MKNAGLEDDMPNNRAAESTGRTKSCRAFRQVVSFFPDMLFGPSSSSPAFAIAPNLLSALKTSGVAFDDHSGGKLKQNYQPVSLSAVAERLRVPRQDGVLLRLLHVEGCAGPRKIKVIN